MTAEEAFMTPMLCLIVGLAFSVAAGINKNDDRQMSVACFSFAICWWVLSLIPVIRWVAS